MGSDLPTIVIVDDSAEVRSLIKARLSGLLDVVAEGADGVEAIGLAYQHQPSLLLLDMSMPSMDGLDTLPGVLAIAPDTRVVIFTGFEERDLAERALERGAAAFIEKSIPIDTLADRLIEVLPTRGSPSRASRRGLTLVGDEPAPLEGPRGVTDQGLLDEHLERFREVFDEAAIGMATMTLSGTIVRANRALGELMLCEYQDLVGVDYGMLTSGGGELLDSALADINERAVDLAHFEHEISGWDEPPTALATLAPVRDSKGQALYVFLQVQDITAQSKAEDQLRRSEERFRLLVEAVEDYAIFMLDPQGHVVSWNTGAQRIKGYTAQEIIGQHFRIFYRPEQQAESYPEHELELALRDGQYAEEGWRVGKDGTQFWANVVITAVFDETGKHIGFAKVTRDISERRRTEQERAESTAALASVNTSLEALNAQLRQTAAEQTQFLAVAAHELRTPATVLGGSADTLASHWSTLTDDERRSLLGGMATSAGRLQRLLSDLLTVAKLDAKSLSIRTEAISLSAVVAQAENTVRSANPRAKFLIASNPDVDVLADPERLAQALENLLDNALRHGSPPVSVTVTTSRRLATIRVADSGHGVATGTEPRLFQRFATGDDNDGTGLGLFIAREFARAQGGDVYYEPSPEEQRAGAFVLSVPLA